MKGELKKIIETAIKGLVKEPVDFSVEFSDDKNHGDYSSNVALILAKKLGRNPKEVASEIIVKVNQSLIRANKGVGFDKIEIAGPGFINFFIADKVFIDNLKSIDKNFGKGNELKGKKIIIDYTDPNLFKEFHVGHLMNNSIGESLSRIFEFEGAKVKRVCYQSDIGLNVAKAVYGMQQMDWKNLKLDEDKKIKELGAAYALGSNKYETDEIAKKKIVEINKKIFKKNDVEINKLYFIGKKISLEHFDKIYKKLDTKFDELISESQVVDTGKKIVEENLGKVFEKGDNGAIIFRGEKYGLHTRVFINSEGLPTYEAKDLGLAEFKDGKYKYNKSVVITASEQNDYFKVMLCALDKINPELAEKTKHIGHGMLRLPEGKMSSRTGKVITGESLIEKVEELVKEKVKDRELTEKEKEEIIESVAIGAIRYSILKQSVGSDIIYDFDKSISFEGDSGPYLQYSYTRAKSVLRKATIEKIKSSFKKVPDEVTELEKAMYSFPEIVQKSQNSCEPHYLVLYLTELAGLFNGYYANNKIVDKSNMLSPYRIALTNAFAIIMKNGMWMLGIKTLERM